MRESIFLKLEKKTDLSFEDISTCFSDILHGGAAPELTAKFLIALREKKESEDEIRWARELLKSTFAFGEKDRKRLFSKDLTDSCGTGGDLSGTFNISTIAAMIAAGAGAKIAKHGNRAFSSHSGSADMLEQLGIRIRMNPDEIQRSLDQTNFTFLFAPFHHAAIKNVSEARKQIKGKTIFNLLGPLLNPLEVKRQLMGVWDENLLPVLGKVFSGLHDYLHVLIVHGNDGLDEITLTQKTKMVEVKQNNVSAVFEFDPKDYGFDYCNPKDLKGGDPSKNAEIAVKILKEKEKSPKRDISILNAAAVLYVSGVAHNIQEGVEKAAQSIGSGQAWHVVEKLRILSSLNPK